tara:strand:- start:341 stop:586 length:246 start_codon:yes stop_codon:yes gene_type:complete
MKRMKMQEMKDELNREITAVNNLKTAAFNDNDLDAFFMLSERMNGLFYAWALLRGSETLGCYQTGMNRNSHGATYTKKVVE